MYYILMYVDINALTYAYTNVFVWHKSAPIVHMYKYLLFTTNVE